MDPNAEPNYFDMADDEIGGLSNPAVVEPPSEPPVDPVTPADPVDPSQAPADPVESPADPVDPPQDPVDPPTDPVDPVKDEAPAQDEPPTDPKPVEPDYKAFYESLIGQPIRASGKDITLKSPEEVKQAIQQGLHFTRKMQALQPKMRLVTMLEKHGLNDEAKLAHLIDLDKGNPQAIQKFLQDKQFDPMKVDTDEAAKYTPGNHQVSDLEMRFNAVLDDLESTPEGAELVKIAATQWDQASQKAVYQKPEFLELINEHRSNGLYARINEEMERQRLLGNLNGEPYLQSYLAIGEMLLDQMKQQANPPVQAPVETRVVAPKAPVKNTDKAAAAAPTRATPSTVNQEIDYLSLSDDDFLKKMEGRL